MPSASDFLKQYQPPPADDDGQAPPPGAPTAGASPVRVLPGDDRGLEAAQAIRHGLGVAEGQVPPAATNVITDPIRFGAQVGTGQAQPDMSAQYPTTQSPLDAYTAAATRGATEGAVIGGGVGATTGAFAGGPVGALTGGLYGAGSGAVTGAVSGLGSEFVQRNFPNSLWGYGPEVTGVVLGGGKDVAGGLVRLGGHLIALPLHAASHGLTGLASGLGHVATDIAGGIVAKSGAWGRRLVNSVIGLDAGVQNQNAAYQAQQQQKQNQLAMPGGMPVP